MRANASDRDVSYADNAPKQLPDQAVFNAAYLELIKVSEEKKELAEREREALKSYKNAGGDPRVLKDLRRIEKMDPDDRASYFHELDAMATYKAFW